MILTSSEQIKTMQDGGRILAGMVRRLAALVKPGIRTNDLEQAARNEIADAGVKSSFLGYNDYPAVLCTSINAETVHAVPSERIVAEGDLVKIDFGIIYGGLHTDMAVTVLASDGQVRPEYRERLTLLRVTREALYKGIAQARVGQTIGHIGAAVSGHISQNGFVVVPELGGHGIGHTLHEEPFVGNFGEPGEGEDIVEGMALAIEPISSMGSWKIKNTSDGFGYTTKDGALSAHFEHTIVVTAKGPLIVTE